jgi:integrase/mRNA-degrading endonuclease RelE of RelBE toxin-antitoxin system
LYRVGEVFYYRRKIKGKLFRISLRTKNIKVALYRRKLLDLLEGEELFKLKQGDYELIFEYDSIEELKEILEATKATQEQIEQSINQYQKATNTIEIKSRNIQPEYGVKLKWNDLEIKFVEAKRKAGKVSQSTYKAYASTFNKLNEFFNRKTIDSLTVEDYEEFREYLAKKYKLKNKTINNHMIYVNTFLDFGVNRQLLKFNPVKALESLKEEESPKENFTDEDIQKILEYSFEKNVKTFFKIAIYSGMRLHEIHNLKNKDIKQDSECIYYFDINKSKTKSGIRKVPIPEKILNEILETDFPIFKNKTTDAVQKTMSRNLKKIIPEKTKTFHSFRGTFISKAVENYPEKIVAIQEIVGHSKSDKDKLTLDTYAKGFSLKLKKEIVDSVDYFS